VILPLEIRPIPAAIRLPRHHNRSTKRIEFKHLCGVAKPASADDRH